MHNVFLKCLLSPFNEIYLICCPHHPRLNPILSGQALDPQNIHKQHLSFLDEVWKNALFLGILGVRHSTS